MKAAFSSGIGPAGFAGVTHVPDASLEASGRMEFDNLLNPKLLSCEGKGFTEVEEEENEKLPSKASESSYGGTALQMHSVELWTRHVVPQGNELTSDPGATPPEGSPQEGSKHPKEAVAAPLAVGNVGSAKENGNPVQAVAKNTSELLSRRPTEQILPVSFPPPPPGREKMSCLDLKKASATGGMPNAKEPSMVFVPDNLEMERAETVKEVVTAPAKPSWSGSVLEADASTHTQIHRVAARFEPGTSSKRSFPETTQAASSAVLLTQVEVSEEMLSFEMGSVPVETSLGSTVEQIENHVQFLRSTGQDELKVVLRPDAQTRLHLTISKIAGEIFLQASCEGVSTALLETHWPTLQALLASQNIRLDSLQTGGGHSAFEQTARQSRNESQEEARSGSRGKKQEERATRSSGEALHGWWRWA